MLLSGREIMRKKVLISAALCLLLIALVGGYEILKAKAVNAQTTCVETIHPVPPPDTNCSTPNECSRLCIRGDCRYNWGTPVCYFDGRAYNPGQRCSPDMSCSSVKDDRVATCQSDGRWRYTWTSDYCGTIPWCGI